MRLLTDVTPLRTQPRFRRLFAGTALSGIGSGLTAFAVPLQVYDSTRSPLAVGVLGVVGLGPTLALGLLGGPVLDAKDRRSVVLVCSSALAVVSAVLAGLSITGLTAVWPLYVLVAIQSGLNAVNVPARRAMTPGLLPPSQLAAGLALNRLSLQLTMVVGPALAGVITAAAGGHLQACYLVDFVSFGAALYGVARLPAMPPDPGAARPGLRAVVEGARFIRRSQVLAGAFLADLNATVFGLPVALFPAINAERFGGRPVTLGLFTAAIGVGGLISSALTGPVSRVVRPGLIMLVTVAIWGAAFTGYALAGSLWLTLSMLALAGAADTFSVVFRSIIVQAVTTEALRGRLTSAEYAISVGGDSLGRLESGALGSLTTPVFAALAGGLATVVLSGVIGVAMPGFARYRLRPAGDDADRSVTANTDADRSVTASADADRSVTASADADRSVTASADADRSLSASSAVTPGVPSPADGQPAAGSRRHRLMRSARLARSARIR
jgi:MFS family permease